MDARQLNRRLTIQQRSTTRDPDLGSEIIAWTDVATVRCKFDPIRGREYYTAKQQQAETVVRFWIRYRSGVLPEMRAVFEGKHYDIEDVINSNGAYVFMELMTREGLTDG